MTSVSFGGVAALAFTIESDTRISAQVGFGAGGEVSVNSPAGSDSKSGFSFIPAITSFSPAMGTTGTVVRITGTYFTGTTEVKFGNKPASSFTVIDPTTIEAVVGPGASGAILISTPYRNIIQSGFAFTGITAFSPASGEKGETITLTGTNLSNVSSVKFGNVEAQSFIINSATKITAVLGEGGSGDVSVMTPMGVSSVPGFSYIENKQVPQINSFSPSTALAGTTVTILGANFADVSAVKFGGTEAASFTVNDAGTITAVVGEGSSGDISVICKAGTATAAGFVYQSSAAPQIAGFSPAQAAEGSAVTITGVNFTGVNSVAFGGTEARQFTVESATTIKAIVAAGSSGEVSVTTATGTARAAGFGFIAAPVISSFSPASAAEGITVTITGENFSETSAVFFGSRPASKVDFISANIIKAVVGSGSSGDLSVSTAGGWASRPGFVFIEGPMITSFSPASAGTGMSLTISGEHFENITAVNIGGIPARSFTVDSYNQITAVVGEGASGSVSVVAAAGEASKSGFTFVPAPAISSFSPAIAPPGATVTIVGRNLAGTSTLSFGGRPAASFTVNSAGVVTAVVGECASGAVALETPGGKASLEGFVFVPALTISADGPTTFSSGNSVVLTANTDLSYSYQWSRNGVDILGATSLSYTAVASGSYTVSITNGSNRITSAPIIIHTIFTLPVSNFTVVAKDKSCKSTDNGSVEITAQKYLKYRLNISGEGTDENYAFTLKQKISNLKAGRYTLCVTVEEEPDYKQYFEVVISQPQELSVYSVVQDKQLTLSLDGGSVYKVELNGKLMVTADNKIQLELVNGNNTLKISTDKECQGVFEKTYLYATRPVAYPNPFESHFTVNLGFVALSEVKAEIRTTGGELVYRTEYPPGGTSFVVEPRDLPAGIYLLKVSTNEFESVIKVVKK